MINFRLFENHSEYTAMTSDTATFITPNVSRCIQEKEAHFSLPPYEKQYLSFRALEDSTFTFTNNGVGNVYYSLDYGRTWTLLEDGTPSPTVLISDLIMLKGDLIQSSSNIGTFSSSGRFLAQGNIMSLLYGDDFIDKVSLSGKNSIFQMLFSNSKIVSAENLVLPATTLADMCYYYMFYNCSGLTTAPQLSATTLADYCYSSMFQGCTSLTSAPQLLATTLAAGCYGGMFGNCTSLTTAPVLSATTLADYCYSNMFQGCTSLTTAPVLSATALAEGCYGGMFSGCTSLNYIKALFTTTPSTTYTSNWVNGVAASGVFVRNEDATWNVRGVHGIPTSWDEPQLVIEYTLPSGGGRLYYSSSTLSSDVSSIYMDGSAVDKTVSTTSESGKHNVDYIFSAATPSVPASGFSSFSAAIITISDLSIRSNIETIGDYAFRGCSGFSKINIPSSVTSIGIAAFSGCSAVTDVTISSSVTSIGTSALTLFSNVLTSATVDPNNTKYDSRCNGVVETSTNKLILGTNVTTVIPNTITTIGIGAYRNQASLTSITIPNSVTSIESVVFLGCTSLSSITFPTGITTLSPYVIYRCSNITSVTIPNSVTSIGNNAIRLCTKLKNITLPSGITSVGTSAFCQCTAITTLNFPDKTATIQTDVCIGCTSMTSATVGTGVTTINANAFRGCTKLASFTCKATTPPTLGADVFTSTSSSLVIYVPSASVAAYKAASGWVAYAAKIQAMP